MQLDLFMHSADVGLRNAVVEALRSRDAATMRVAIDRLRADFPGDDHLDGFERLFSGLSALTGTEQTSTDIAGQLDLIETQLLPSVQATPSLPGVPTHLPSLTSHASVVHGLPSSHAT